MSKIKDAIEKAKRIRGASAPFVLIEEGAENRDESIQQAAQTKVINFSRETVQRHNIVSLESDNIEFIERFKFLKTQVLTKTQMHGDRTILVTSCLNGEGKTFNALNLAVTFAKEIDQTVLLVDVNLKKPSVLRTLGIHEKEGLTDYLLHDIPLHDLLIRPGIEKLVILPAGNFAINATELLGSVKLQLLVAEMKNRYQDRYIFFDGPSILKSVDTLVLSKFIDKVLLVVESGKVSPEKMVEAINLIGKEKILGTILNRRTPA